MARRRQPPLAAWAICLACCAAPAAAAAASTLSGHVVDGAGGPVADVAVTLLSTEHAAAGCSASHPPGSVAALSLEAAMTTTALCTATTGADGRWELPGVPSGEFTLQAARDGCAVEPASVAVTVGASGAAAAPRPFVVTGFSVAGRVVDAEGAGVGGVAISLAGEEVAATDLNGRYVLPRVPDGPVDVTAARRHYAFTWLTGARPAPGDAELPDIVATAVALCGAVASGDAARLGAAGRAVTLTGAGGEQQEARTDAAGAFCFMAPPGPHRLAPVLSPAEAAAGLAFTPPHLDVEVRGEPVLLGTAFTHGLAALSGAVVCLGGPCPGDVALELRRPGGALAAGARLGDVALRDRQATGGTVAFALSRVPAGTYRLAAARPGWCWAPDDGVEVVVRGADVAVQAPPLVQRDCDSPAAPPPRLAAGGLDWRAPALVLVLLLAGGATVLAGGGRRRGSSEGGGAGAAATDPAAPPQPADGELLRARVRAKRA
ncbi:Nomo1 [Scenedesmus sp. PABB004]|nr:Nomo1 [Scenedesmus sp. PABB004]